MAIYPILRRPRRRFPLSGSLNDLRKPYKCSTLKIRSSRVDRDKDGYDVEEDPTKIINHTSRKSVIDDM